MTTACGKWFCEFCEHEVPGAPEHMLCPLCDDGPAAFHCGGEPGDEKVRLCSDCEEKQLAYWRNYFRAHPAKSSPQMSDEEWQQFSTEMRRLKE